MKKLLVLLLLMVLLSVAVVADIRVTKASQDPDPVLAGDVVKVRFKVENTLEDTRSVIQTELVPAFPFMLYGSDPVQNLGRLVGGDAVVVEYSLKVDPDAVDGNNELKLHVFAEDNASYAEQVFFIDVESDKIILKPYIVSSDLITAGKRGKFTVEVANAGENNVQSLELQVLSSSDYRLLSTSNYVYLGDLDADDTESQDFDVFVPEGTLEVKIPVLLNYRVNNHDYSEKTDLVLSLLSPAEAKQVGLVQSSNAGMYVVIILVVVIGFFVLRRLRKKKQ
ncbi:MAG: hypothetical protein Q7R96_03050 [Nanoarchaeota archaeon]|nr:hypothetical protein [Nanoarchaeota archaeon]